MTVDRRTAGFTLVEMLMAAAILMVMLGALGGLLVNTNRAYETNRAVTASAGQLRGAIQAVQYDVGMSGFCGVASACSVDTPLSIETVDQGGDRSVTSLTSRYVENRYVSEDSVVEVTYSVVEGELLRRVDGGQPVAIAEGIVSLKLVGYRSSADLDPVVRFIRPAGAELVGVDLQFEYRQGQATRSEQFTVLLQNPQ